jgi:hypothetical protein
MNQIVVLHKAIKLRQLGHKATIHWSNSSHCYFIRTNILYHSWFSYNWSAEHIKAGIKGRWYTWGKQEYWNPRKMTRFLKKFYPHHINFWTEDLRR